MSIIEMLKELASLFVDDTAGDEDRTPGGIYTPGDIIDFDLLD